MNEITMIPIRKLMHHPDNPRVDLGDLTELTESIRQNGIMQNLTVVPSQIRGLEDWYMVVIGNRRMDAAYRAGLAEVPCVISDMDHKTQVATMLMENMQRSDLTLYEQATGFQMMMDLGYTAREIGEKTGFGETTVRRRLKMAELDGTILKEKCSQLTMDDLDKLNKIQDIGKRNELLKEAGTNNFKWKIDNAVDEQRRNEVYRQIKGILEQAGCIEKSTNGVTNFWKDYEYLPYGTTISLDKYKAGENILPEDERQLYFYKEYSGVRFWAEKRKAKPEEEEEEPDEEELAREKEAQDAWEKLKEIEKHAKESRAEFIAGMSLKQKDTRKALEWMFIGLVATDNDTVMAELLPEYDDDQLDALPKGHIEKDLDLKWIREQIDENPSLFAEVMDQMFFAGEDCLMNRWRTSDKPEYCRNVSMITGYEWLEDFGYQVSDDERAYIDGTLDCYKERGNESE